MGVSKNSGTPKSSILIGFSIINHPFWDTPIFGNIHICTETTKSWAPHLGMLKTSSSTARRLGSWMQNNNASRLRYTGEGMDVSVDLVGSQMMERQCFWNQDIYVCTRN